jgi:hypothetical protein
VEESDDFNLSYRSSNQSLKVLHAFLKIMQKFGEEETATKDFEVAALVRRLPPLVSDEYQKKVDEWFSSGDATKNWADPTEFLLRFVDCLMDDQQEIAYSFWNRYFNLNHLFLF